MAILTVEELRKHIDYPTGSDADDALQRLLDAAEEAILEAVGAAGAITELFDGGLSRLILARPITSITTVIEDSDGTVPLTLSADDYRFTVGGFVIERLSTGTNPGYAWWGKVSVAYTPVDDTSTRELVQIELVQSFLDRHPGLTARAIGEWSESFADSVEVAAAWDASMARLSRSAGMVVIN